MDDLVSIFCRRLIRVSLLDISLIDVLNVPDSSFVVSNKTWNVGSFANLKYLSVGLCVAKLFSVLSNANKFLCPAIQYGCRVKPVFIQTARDFPSN